MASEIVQAIKHVCEEKGLSYDTVLETIQTALAAAYRKDYGDRMQNIEIEFDAESGGMKAFDVKTVVEDISQEELEAIELKQAELHAAREAAKASGEPIPEVDETEDDQKFNPKTDIMHSQARVLKMNAALGDVLRTELPVPGEFGRMAAMTAKQVIMQKLREAEREIIFNEYKEYEGEVLIGTVQRREGRVILVDLGRTTAVMVPEDQVRTERYTAGQRIKVFVREVSLGARGPQILVSRTSEMLVRELFDIEIPEVNEGIVEIKGVAREPGARTKIAVSSNDESVDPVGACIGQRGTRIQTIINELNGEKIDVIEWKEDDVAFIMEALSPAKVLEVRLSEDEKAAFVKVAEDQLSLAIGRGGQNVRLAARLTGWNISVAGDGAAAEVLPESQLKADEALEVSSEVIEDLETKAEDAEDAADEFEAEGPTEKLA
jgi:N utilization substance protein A